MKIAIAFFVVLNAFPCFAQSLADSPKQAPGPKASKGETLQWTSPQGKPYLYRLPKKIPKDGANLVFMFHGTGMSHYWAFANYPIGSGNFRPHDIVVSPEGMTPGYGKSFNFVQNEQDEGQVVELIKEFRSHFKIKRIFLYGHSQGAFFVYWMAGRQPELINGIIAHAGNVLNSVPHTKYAKEHLAVAILHGRADAVVPVAAAIATEEFYRKQGYKNLKLEIVEGLTEKSGHWPLPGAVRTLFGWLDTLSTSTVESALEGLSAERAKKKPSLDNLLILTTKAESLLKKYRGAKKAVLAEKVALARLELNQLCLRAAELCLQEQSDPKLKEDQLAYALFRSAHQIFRDEKAWQKAVGRRSITAAKNGEKKIAKAEAKLARKWSKKTFLSSQKLLLSSYHAADYSEFGKQLLRMMTENKTDIAAARQEEVKRLVAKTATLDAEAAKRLASLLAP